MVKQASRRKKHSLNLRRGGRIYSKAMFKPTRLAAIVTPSRFPPLNDSKFVYPLI